MFLRSLALTALTTLAACGGGHADSSPSPAATLQQSADRAVKEGLPGMVLAHLTTDNAAQAVAGLRQLGTAAKIQAADAFLIGSTTKAMTSALAGRLVERGTLAWTTTLAEALPDLAAGMNPAYRTVTLEQLLNHKGGVAAFTGSDDRDRIFAFLQSYPGELPTTLAGRERFFAAWLLAQNPAPGVTPGQTYLYSNAGYALAALMLETRAGRSFADLFEDELAKPLGLAVSWTSGDAAVTNRPVGHRGTRGKLQPVPVEDAFEAGWADVLRASGQGTTLAADSYAAWVRWHLRALRGDSTPLAGGYLQRIKAAKAGDYVLGWIAADLDGRAVLTHTGADGGFSSMVVADAQGRTASFCITNAETEDDWVGDVMNVTLLELERALPPAK